MSRKSSRRIKLNPEVRPHERAVRQFLDETAGKPPVLPEGSNFQITWLEPSVMRELQIREHKAKQRCRASGTGESIGPITGQVIHLRDSR